jgi:hypothetical protein
MILELAAVAALLARGGSHAAATPTSAAIQDPHPCAPACEIQRFLDQNIGIHFDRPVTLVELRKFAKVQSETTSKYGASGLADTIHEIKYAGLTVKVQVTAENTVLVESIDLTSGPYRMPFNIRLGKVSGPHDIDFVLGPPAQTRVDAGKPTKWIYHNLEGTAQVTFDRQDNAIVAVHWDYTAGN